MLPCRPRSGPRAQERRRSYLLGVLGDAAVDDIAPQLTIRPQSQCRSPRMMSSAQPRFSRTAVLVLAVLLNVHLGSSPALERRGAKPLPAPVEEMREAILAATRSGRIEDLQVPIDWNELKPDFAATAVDDPIAFWKKESADGEGREILAVLANILQMRPAELPLGKDIENNIVYVWPYLAEARLDALTPAEEVDLLRLVSPERAKAMRAAKTWTWWRLSIGADGTWHAFKKSE